MQLLIKFKKTRSITTEIEKRVCFFLPVNRLGFQDKKCLVPVLFGCVAVCLAVCVAVCGCLCCVTVCGWLCCVQVLSKLGRTEAWFREWLNHAEEDASEDLCVVCMDNKPNCVRASREDRGQRAGRQRGREGRELATWCCVSVGEANALVGCVAWSVLSVAGVTAVWTFESVHGLRTQHQRVPHVSCRHNRTL